MKTITTFTLVLILAVSGLVFARGRGMGTLIADMPYEELSRAEEKAILKMREEEKLARDVYITLYNEYRNRVFKEISRAEQKHMDAVKGLIEKYSLADPVVNDEVGAFTTNEFQVLYEQLVTEGKKSQVDALKVGATIEDLDIFDLQQAINKADNQDVRMVFQNLMKGSRNHLRVFCRQLAAVGTKYVAQHLTQDEIQQILDSPREKGAVDADGNSLKNGRSKNHVKKRKKPPLLMAWAVAQHGPAPKISKRTNGGRPFFEQLAECSGKGYPFPVSRLQKCCLS